MIGCIDQIRMEWIPWNGPFKLHVIEVCVRRSWHIGAGSCGVRNPRETNIPWIGPGTQSSVCRTEHCIERKIEAHPVVIPAETLLR